MKNHIVAGIDGSPESEAAVDEATDLARATGASLQIVYVVPSHPPAGPGAYTSECNRSDVTEQDYAPALLRQFELRCARKGVAVDSMTALGPVAETIADIAKASDASRVVVGHRSRGAFRRVLLGSVADRLVQISPAPVLVVR